MSVLAVTREPVDLAFAATVAVTGLGFLARRMARRPVDPWVEAVRTERAREHGRLMRARRRRAAAWFRRDTSGIDWRKVSDDAASEMRGSK